MLQEINPEDKPLIGISGCLLGQQVRFNGGHSKDRFITDVLSRVFQWRSFCPEMAAGMGTPRETVRLVGDLENPRVLAPKSKTDWTDQLNAVSKVFAEDPNTAQLNGFILKRKSPSCGMERVTIYRENGGNLGSGMGVFAAALHKAYPLLPLEEEGRLNDPPLRESFVIRVFAYKAWKEMLEAGVTAGDLVAFHARNKMLLTAHNPNKAKALGKMVAKLSELPLSQAAEQYGAAFMDCLSRPPKRKYHVNVLYRFLGFLKDHLSDDDRRELLADVERYRSSLVPLSVPLTLLNHHLRHNPHPWANHQTYLKPYPDQLPIRHYMI